jgi:dTDP-4-dehydrorhamnose 3,5-epimerase
MEFRTFDVEGPLEVRPRKIEDDRGYFSEIFRLDEFAKHSGIVEFVQDNQSLSTRAGTIRGIHFQSHPAAQGKLVRCLAGKLFDVAVDLRKQSPTFGRSVSVFLTPDDNNQLWIPVGFGHAFCTIEPNSIISYRVTSYYSAENDKGVAWNDTEIGVEWPELADPQTLSQKDRLQPRLCDLPDYFQ